MEYPETPELDRMLAVHEQAQEIGEFLEWLGEHAVLCTYDSEDELWPVNRTIQGWLAAYFGLDEKKMDRERDAVLAYVREQNSKGE